MKGYVAKNDLRVPITNSVANTYMWDVIGNKSDGHFGGSNVSDSVYAYLKSLEEHIHRQGFLYPDKANAIPVTSGVGVWAAGALTPIVPAGTITSDYDVHQVDFSDIDTSTSYQIDFFHGVGNTFAFSVPVSRGTFLMPANQVITICPKIPANDQLDAICYSQNAGSAMAEIKIQYHVY